MKLVVKIPPHKELLVTIEQTVDTDSPFLKTTSPKQNSIPIARSLGISPQKIFLHLKKFVGDKIQPGDVLAEHKTFFSAKQYLADMHGTITEIDHQTGSILVEVMSDDASVQNCFFRGTVTAVNPPELLELQVNHGAEYPIFPIKDYLGGQMSYYTGVHLSEEDIENRFIIAEEIIPYDQIKYETLGAKGFITLRELQKSSELPSIKMKQIDHFEEIIKKRFPYCIVGQDNATMFFYE